MMIALLLAINVASLGYVCRDKIRAALTRTVYVCTLDDDDLASTRPGHATPHRDDSTRLDVYREILCAAGLDGLRCAVGALMISRQSHFMRGQLLTTGLKPLVASLKKSDAKTLNTYLEQNRC